MALPANPEHPADVAERLLENPNADPAMIATLIGNLNALQDETLNRIEASAADRIGRRTSWTEWSQEAQQIGEGLRYGRLVDALRQLYEVKA